jgi:hypothetical protein
MHMTGVRGSHNLAAQEARRSRSRRRPALALDFILHNDTHTIFGDANTTATTSHLRCTDNIHSDTIRGCALPRTSCSKEGSCSSNSMRDCPRRARSPALPPAPTTRARTPPLIRASAVAPLSSLSHAPQDDLSHDFPLGHRQRQRGASTFSAGAASFFTHLQLQLFHFGRHRQVTAPALFARSRARLSSHRRR